MTIRAAQSTALESLLQLWERSVRATHSFLSPDDVDFFRPLVREALGTGALEVWVLATMVVVVVGAGLLFVVPLIRAAPRPA